MELKEQSVEVKEFKFSFVDPRTGQEVSRTSLVVGRNDLHNEPWGLIEDVFTEQAYEGMGLATKLVRIAEEKAKKLGCYKLILTSRFKKPKIHAWYKRLGFVKWGYEFRKDLKKGE